MTVDELFASFESGFPKRKFSAGLLMAFTDLLLELETPSMQLTSLSDFFAHFPRRDVTRRGGKANALIVQRHDATVNIRKFYDLIETEIRAEHHRFDYPKCAPHATQAWEQHSDWLEVLVSVDEDELRELRQRVLDFVLTTLPDQAFDPANVRREPPLFRYLLDGFDMAKRPGEKTGAIYQGIVFGFVRADNPHLQVDIRKVRTGSARAHAIGDVDCWDGGNLAISAEVKQYVVRDADFAGFANKVNVRGALGMVVALDFVSEDVRQEIEDLGVRTLSLNDLVEIVDLWDPIKQRIAVSSLRYYVEQVEQSSALAKRLREYLKEQTEIHGPGTGESKAEASPELVRKE